MPVFWAAQPTTFAGTVSTARSIKRLMECTINKTAQNFYNTNSNLKFEVDGGNVSNSYELALTTFDMAALESGIVLPGTYWSAARVVWQAEGPSANTAADMGTLTATIAAMRIESCNETDQGGRRALQVTARCVSATGAAAPVTFAVAS